MLTSKKLAERLGLAQATVSMALHDHPEISLTTRRRVQQAAARLHYTPSRVARAMRTGKTSLIGVVVPNFYVSYQPAIVTGIENEARRRGYQCLICQSHAAAEIFQREVDVLVEHRVDGLVIVPYDSSSSLDVFHRLQQAKRPFALADMEMDGGLKADAATNDNLEIGRLAAGHLLELGHRRIVCMRDWTASHNMVRRFDGAREAIRAGGGDMDERLVLDRGNEAWDIPRAIDGLLASRTPFSAIIAPADHEAAAVMVALQARGLRVPADVSVIGCGNLDLAALVSPNLTTIDQDAVGQGRAAFELLLERMTRPAAAARHIRVAARLIARASTVPCRHRG